MTAFEIIQSVASIATAVGVGIAAWQLWVSKRQSQSQFEDAFAEQYRRIAFALPLAALIGKRLSGQELNDNLRTFYNYFDLSNEQAFLAAQGRLRKATWKNWREGIEQHLFAAAFKYFWEIAQRYGSVVFVTMVSGMCKRLSLRKRGQTRKKVRL